MGRGRDRFGRGSGLSRRKAGPGRPTRWPWAQWMTSTEPQLVEGISRPSFRAMLSARVSKANVQLVALGSDVLIGYATTVYADEEMTPLPDDQLMLVFWTVRRTSAPGMPEEWADTEEPLTGQLVELFSPRAMSGTAAGAIATAPPQQPGQPQPARVDLGEGRWEELGQPGYHRCSGVVRTFPDGQTVHMPHPIGQTEGCDR